MGKERRGLKNNLLIIPQVMEKIKISKQNYQLEERREVTITSINTDNDNNIVDGYYYHDRIIKDTINSSEFPTTIKPMLATLIDKPFDNKEWVFEVKWDGVRAILFLHKTKGILKIVSRNGK